MISTAPVSVVAPADSVPLIAALADVRTPVMFTAADGFTLGAT